MKKSYRYSMLMRVVSIIVSAAMAVAMIPFASLAEGTGQPDQPADNRYYLTFVLGYDDTLMQAELERKGLDQSAKLGKVEVAQ